MPGTPRWKVYNARGEYVAACVHVEDSAAVLALHEGGTIRDGSRNRRIVFRDGIDGNAADSFDAVAQHVGSM